MTKIAVALCTYNGDRFLGQQLASLVAQSLPANTIVACDDGSTDATCEQLTRWKSDHDCIQVHHNETNLGAIQNFAKAISLAQGDLIFLSDQDDVWEPGKIEKISRVFADHPSVGYVFTDAVRIDEDGNRLDQSLWQSLAQRFCPRRSNHGFNKPADSSNCCAVIS